jgi:hypothetical protein
MVVVWDNYYVRFGESREDPREKLPTEGELRIGCNDDHNRAGICPVGGKILQVIVEAFVGRLHITLELNRLIQR